MPDFASNLVSRIAAHWVAAALASGVVFGLSALVLQPLLPAAIGLVLLAGPAYMLHQVEEHAGDRFRRFVNERVFGGVEALTTGDVLVINLPGVWGLNLAALYGAVLAAPGWGLAAAYLMVVNAVSHVAMAVRLKAYNPGLVTAILLFLPIGGLALIRTPATIGEHLAGLGIAIAIHAAIALNALRRARRARQS